MPLSRRKVTVIALTIAASVAGVAVGLFIFRPVTSLPLAIKIGGSFTLTSHKGTPFRSGQLDGRAYALQFGFTHCPDICPTVLQDFTNLLQQLGTNADRLQVLFVSVDPQRDTPKALARYLANFDPRIIGLTGPVADIRRLARAYRASFRKVPAAGGYTIDHTASVFLVNTKGQFAGVLDLRETEASKLAKLRSLLADAPATKTRF